MQANCHLLKRSSFPLPGAEPRFILVLASRGVCEQRKASDLGVGPHWGLYTLEWLDQLPQASLTTEGHNTRPHLNHLFELFCAARIAHL